MHNNMNPVAPLKGKKKQGRNRPCFLGIYLSLIKLGFPKCRYSQPVNGFTTCLNARQKRCTHIREANIEYVFNCERSTDEDSTHSVS